MAFAVALTTRVPEKVALPFTLGWRAAVTLVEKEEELAWLQQQTRNYEDATEFFATTDGVESLNTSDGVPADAALVGEKDGALEFIRALEARHRETLEALGEAVARLVGDDELRRRLGEGARARGLAFSPEVLVPRYEAVYRELQ